MFSEKDSAADRQKQKKTVNSVISLLSAIMVLCGVSTVTVGDAPIVPYKFSSNLEAEASQIWLPICIPSAGRIPMLTFLPSFRNTNNDSEVSQGQVPENALPVLSLTLQPPASMNGEDGVYINNEANKSINPSELLGSENTFFLKKDGSVSVIIYHTHGTESYNNEGLSYYGDEFYDVHSEDLSQNVVHIGQIITEKLRKSGIGVVHDTKMYDYEDYNNAYSRSCAGVEALLDLYPNAKIILDIHRDTIVLKSGVKYRPVVDYNGKNVAQMMILVGTGKASAPNDHWQENLSMAMKLQREAENICENVMRPILLRNSGYNQHLSNGSILVEMGTCGNSLKEAELAAEILSKAIINAFAEK